MAPLPDYVAGTITLTNGSTAFTGSGTGWLAAGFREGDTILGIEDNPGVVYVVESVTDNDSGTLTQPWDGPTGTYTYRMRYLSDGQRVTAQARQLIEMLGNGNLQAVAGLPGTPNTFMMFTGAGSVVEVPRTDLVSGANYDVQVDTLAERAAYDGSDEGFAVLVANTGDGRAAIYSKLSNAVGDWSDPAYVTGPAVTLDVGSVTPVAFGNDPDVTLTPVAGGYEFDFELPENATFQSGTITTLDPGEDATFSLSPVAGGYALNLGVPRGPTGDINGVTPFWQGRITVDTTLAQARGGLTPGERGVFFPSNFAADDLTPAETRAAIGGVDGFYKFANPSSGANIQFPPQWVTQTGQTYGSVTGWMADANGYQYSWQEMTGAFGNRKWMRRATSPTTWSSWAEVWHSGNMPLASQAEVEAGTGTDLRALTPQRLAQAIAALAPEVPADVYKRSNILGTVSQSGGVPTGAIIERGSNANGEYVRWADGTQICTRMFTFSGSYTGWGGIFALSLQGIPPMAAGFVGEVYRSFWLVSSPGEASAMINVIGNAFALARGTTAASGDFTVSISVKGRWF